MKIGTPEQLARYVEHLARQRLPLEVEAKPWKATRSSEQNNWLWGVAYPPLVERTGYTADEIHTYALGRHFGWTDKKTPKTPRNPEGLESVPVRTTTRNADGKRSVLTKAEFRAFTDTVERIASDAGCYISEGWKA